MVRGASLIVNKLFKYHPNPTPKRGDNENNSPSHSILFNGQNPPPWLLVARIPIVQIWVRRRLPPPSPLYQAKASGAGPS